MLSEELLWYWNLNYIHNTELLSFDFVEQWDYVKAVYESTDNNWTNYKKLENCC